jgi:ribosomal protein L34E
MCKHENKTCPGCNSLFECKLGDIAKCQCYEIKLNDEERDYIARRYADCLCADCMQELRTTYHQVQQEIQLKQFFGLK